jgi:MerR family transcriptional regulator, redox-sensitive transcriptional activator SoxR
VPEGCPTKRRDDLLAIGEVAARSGLAASAIRYYEAEGLITSTRSPTGHRRFARHTLRRLAFIRAARRVGLSLDDVAASMRPLPAHRAPTKAEWATISRTWRTTLDERIADLERLRDDLTGCIGCGCLSLVSCRLYNPGDGASATGTGPRYLLGDDPARSAGSARSTTS